MIAYHGTTIGKLKNLISAIENKTIRWPGLSVTDTPQRAARYANAQASGEVDPGATELTAEHAAIVTLEIPNDTHWYHRDKNHNTLDVCEAIVDAVEITSIAKNECDYFFCSCHQDLDIYSVKQAAHRIGLSEQRIRKLCGEHRCGRKIGGRWIITHSGLDSLARQLIQDHRSPLSPYYQKTRS